MKNVRLAVLVAALGYFVDVYDIILFTAVRIPSLQSLQLPPEQITSTGLFLLQVQLIGMLIGGFAWGIFRDKKGRVSTLFGSILLYSLANLMNSLVHNVETYAICRFFAGIGLAGELGAGVTLVSEMMSREKRGYGTMIIAICGVLGGVAGGLSGDLFSWRIAYVLGGVLGLALLFLRWKTAESSLFTSLVKTPVARGRLKSFFEIPGLLKRYLLCLLLGAPIWIFIGVFITLSPEITRSLKMEDPVSAGKAILFYNIGFGIGDLGSSLLSQWLRSRKKAVAWFIGIALIAVIFYLNPIQLSSSYFYAICTFLGIGGGYWAVFLMLSVEQFGTNMRATIATSLPNMVRVLVVPVSIAIQYFRVEIGFIPMLWWVGLGSLIFSAVALSRLKETYGVDLEFTEGK